MKVNGLQKNVRKRNFLAWLYYKNHAKMKFCKNEEKSLILGELYYKICKIEKFVKNNGKKKTRLLSRVSSAVGQT